MMKHTLYWLTLSTLLFAQPLLAQDGDGRQKIEAARIGYITNRVNLTPEQAQPFWAIYNEYNGRKHDLVRRIRQLNKQSVGQNLVESDVVSNLREMNAAKQKLADLDEEYLNRFLKVISAKQVAELYNTERAFNRQLLERLNGKE
jgi:Spy/CpxP family protein refolding chaperone